MTVVLVLITFTVFVVIDIILHWREAKARRAVATQPATPVPRAEPATRFIEGFRTPAELLYHAGHSWVHRERKNVLRVGLDEFGAAILGRLDALELPKPGHWVRQGQAVLNFRRGEKSATLLCPVEGEVVEVNEAVLKDPALLRADPYGAGWLMTVFAPDEDSVRRNLLPKNLVSAWMREAVERLYARQPQVAGVVVADGGRPVEDVGANFGEERWQELTAEFFITGR